MCDTVCVNGWLSLALRARMVGKEVGFVIAKLTAFSRPTMILAALALLLVLALTWREAPVHTQYLDVSGGASALEGWGMLAAGLLLVFIVAQVFVPNRRRPLLGLAVAVAAVTVLEFVTGSATAVKVDGAIAEAEATLWPAFAGLALAGLLVVAAVARLAEPRKAIVPMPPLRREWPLGAS